MLLLNTGSNVLFASSLHACKIENERKTSTADEKGQKCFNDFLFVILRAEKDLIDTRHNNFAR